MCHLTYISHNTRRTYEKNHTRKPTRQERLSEKYAQGKGRLQINHSFKPLAQIQQKKAQVVRPDLKIDKVSVQRPANLPASFGKV